MPYPRRRREVPTRQRQTMRLHGLPGGGRHDEEIDPDVIYYLKITKPHIQDIVISGPCYPLEQIFDQLLIKLKIERSPQSEAILDELVLSGAFLNLGHFNAPLPDGNTMRLELLRERNAEVARMWPGMVWHVVIATPVMKDGFPVGERHPRIEEAEIHATFTTKEAANADAEKVLEDLKALAGTGAFVEKIRESDLVRAFIVPAHDRQGRTKAMAIEVRSDDGQIQQVDRFGSPL